MALECSICGDETEFEPAVSKAPTSTCVHDPTICKDCMSSYLSAKVHGGEWRSIPCPTEKCGEKLTGRDVDEAADRKTFKKYDALYVQSPAVLAKHLLESISQD